MQDSLSVFDFNSQLVRVILIDNEPWFVAKDVLNAIQSTTTVTHLLSRLDDDEKGITTLNTAGGDQLMSIVSESGLKKVIFKSRKAIAKELAKKLGIEVLCSSIESDCLLILKKSFIHLQPIEQFFINGFRIDLYFPAQRLAIECDENDHRNYNKTKEIERQDTITKALGCKWIRFNPYKKHFCIGDIINKIIKEIYD